ncbi:MAG: hypothetical protein Q8P24_09280 [Desulfobacterales bacterium]|nr:hypothetical protein [Desulfobacterales bacterium]
MDRLGLPKQSVTYLLICTGSLLAFILLSVYPLQRNLRILDRKIDQANFQIAQQKALFPVYEHLLKKIQMKPPEGLPFPVKRLLAGKDLEQIVVIFNKIADNNSLKLSDFKTEIFSMPQGRSYLRVGLTAQGGFFNFHNFLFHLGELPYLEHIEAVKIEAAKLSKGFQLKIWLGQQ